MAFYTNVHLYKNEFLIRGYKDGEQLQYTVPCEPWVFVNSRTMQGGEYRTLDGKPVWKKTFESVYEARTYLKEYEGVSGKEVYGMTNWVYPFINEEYPGIIDYDPKQIAVTTIDIETDSSGGFPDIASADKQVTAITLRQGDNSVVMGYFPYTPESENVEYIQCSSEQELLETFISCWKSPQFNPDIVTGWNCEFFDMPYMINRIKRIIGPESAKRLSPWGILSEREIEINGKTIVIPVIVGITVLDYLQLYKKFSFTMQESYKLDHIAWVVLGERKLDYKELGFETLDEFYRGDFRNYINYNIRDVDLVYRMDDKLKFIEQVYALAYDGKVNFLDTFTSVRMWDVIIHNYLIDQKIVVPMFDPGEREGQEGIEGAYVKEPQTGMHKWVVSFDLNSLYPHLIMQYNISPETYKGMFAELNTDTGVDRILNGALNDAKFRDKMISQNYAVAATGCYFDRDRQGFLPQLMERMYNDRVRFKTEMLDAKKRYESVEAELKRRGIDT